MNKIELMKRLLDLYEQREAVKNPNVQMIVNQYITKLETQLKELLK